MSSFKFTVDWNNRGNDFNYDTYDRNHQITFDGGQKITNSAAPDFKGDAKATNPEELIGAALATCHMLTVLAIASKKKLHIQSYTDSAEAFIDKNSAGKNYVNKIILNPKIVFKDAVSEEVLKDIHQKAHENCIIANTIKSTTVICGVVFEH